MFLILFILFCTLLFIFLKYNHAYWQRRGVAGPAPSLIFGNVGDGILQRTSFGEIFSKIYAEYPNERIVGTFRTTTPTLLIRDPELIKDIQVKSFEHFHANDVARVSKELDPIFSRNFFFLDLEEWRKMRPHLTSAFTSGKMKKCFPLLQIVCKQMVDFIEKQAKNNTYEAKELSVRYTLNNVATCAFGIDGKCFEEENSEFRDLSRRFLTPGSIQMIKILMVLLVPALNKMVSVKFSTKDVDDQLLNIVQETLKHRKANNIVRQDFLQSMDDLKTSIKDFVFNDVDVTAQAAGFFGDGSETSSVVMSFLLYTLAANVEAQNQARNEIKEKLKGRELTYEDLAELTYLDACINETMRMFPPIFNLQKACTKDYTYTPTSSRESVKKPIVIEKGTSIVLPMHAIYNDPQYFSEPDQFKPERFLEGNYPKAAFFPFGQGPRVCIGQRFAWLQIKIGVVYILQNYKLSVNAKTKTPLKVDPQSFLLTPVGGLWLNYERI